VSSLSESPAPRRYWNPYLVGALMGVLSWLAFGLVNNPLGVTTSLSGVSGACAVPVLGAEGVKANPYWAKTPPAWDYGTIFLVGTVLGSLVAALTSRTFRVETVPSVWRERFGPSAGKRLIASFIGGIVIMYGARMAGGCTSGHGISGSLQLAVSSWTFFLTMFITGVIAARVLFRRSR
jgi:hypothetical protein